MKTNPNGSIKRDSVTSAKRVIVNKPERTINSLLAESKLKVGEVLVANGFEFLRVDARKHGGDAWISVQ